MNPIFYSTSQVEIAAYQTSPCECTGWRLVNTSFLSFSSFHTFRYNCMQTAIYIDSSPSSTRLIIRKKKTLFQRTKINGSFLRRLKHTSKKRKGTEKKDNYTPLLNLAAGNSRFCHSPYAVLK